MKEIVSMDNAIVKEVKDEKAYILLYSDTDFKYLDKKGNILTSQNLFENNSLFAKNINGKWGFVDKDGNLKVQNDYELVTDLNKKRWQVGINKSKWRSGTRTYL